MLATHNGATLDYRVFVSAVAECGLGEKLQSACHGFVDTLPLTKNVLKNKSSYTVSSLHKELTGNDFVAHDAQADVKALCVVLKKAKVQVADFQQHSSTL